MAAFSTFSGPLVAVTDSTIASTAAETAFAGGFSIDANSLKVGSLVRAEWGGFYSTTLSPTLNFRVRYGTTSGVLVVDLGAVLGGTGVTNRAWKLVFTGTVRTIGASGTLSGDVMLFVNNGASELVSGTAVAKSTISSVTIDTTATTVINCTLQWSASSSSNTCTRVTEHFARSA